MFQHRFTEKVTFQTHFQWYLLACVAGMINAGGYISCHRFVSHVTGFSTLAGISFAEFKWLDAVGALIIPLFFLGGVMVSAILTERQKPDEKSGEKYAPVMGLVGFLLLIIAVLGTLDLFGAFEHPAEMRQDFLLLALLCGACGLQNAAITSATGATVRTTHLTGLTTDLGLGLVRSEIHDISDEQRSTERRANLLRFLTIMAFTLGSTVGAFIFFAFGYLGFLFPAVISFYFWRVARRS